MRDGGLAMDNISKSYDSLQVVQAAEIPELVAESLACGTNLLIYGEAGCGKSSIIEGLAEHYNIVQLGAASLCEEAINGIPVYDAATKTTPYAKPEFLIKIQKNYAADPEKPQVLFIDEITLARPEVANSLQILLSARALPTHPNDKLPDNLVIVSATNTVAETTEGYELSRPLKTRFITVRMVNTPENFMRYVQSIADDKLSTLKEKLGEERFAQFLRDTIGDFSEHWCDNTEFYGTNPRTIMNFYKACEYAMTKNGVLNCTDASKRAERCTGHKLTRFNWADGMLLERPTRMSNKLAIPTKETIMLMTRDELEQTKHTLATSTRATTAPVIKAICAIQTRLDKLAEEN